jgi:integrase
MRGSLIKVTNLSPDTVATFKKNEFRWRLILSLGRDPATGKWKQKWVTFHGTKTKAEAKLRELVHQIDNGEFVEPSKLSVGEYLEKEWLPKVKAKCSARTYRSYRNIVETHISKSTLGRIPLQQVRPSDVEHYHNTKSAALSGATLRVHHCVLTSALKLAKRDKRVRENAAREAGMPGRKREQRELRAWNEDEARKVLVAAKTRSTQTALFFAVALDSGARKGELQGLKWSDLDLTSGEMKIERQLLKGGPEPEFGPTKTGQMRSVHLGDHTVALLREHKREQAELKMANRLHYQDHGLVFGQTYEHQGQLGTPLPLATIDRMLAKLIEETGVRTISVHGLRHTCATLLLAAGVQPHVVQQRLGHTDISTTLGIYAHVLPSQQADAAAKLGTMLHG